MRILTSICFLLSCCIGHAQDHVIYLYSEHFNSDHIEKVEYRGIKWITDIKRPQLEVYLPAPNQSTGQAVMICPGGGYSGLAYDWEGTDIAKWLNGHGIAGIVLKYRMPNPQDSILGSLIPSLDASKGLSTIHENAENWNIDPHQIGIMGFSAGGHLAASVSYSAYQSYPPGGNPDSTASTDPKFSILVYPVISMKNDITHSGSKKNLLGDKPSDKYVQLFSNEERVTQDYPPTLLIHSADDEAVPVENSLVYYQALKDHNVPVEMHLFQTGGHGYALAINGGQESQWPALCIKWLQSLYSGSE